MANYKLIGQRNLRKYTEDKTSPTYAAAIEAQTIVDSLCGVEWKKVAERDATMTYHTEENVGTKEDPISGLDMNVRIRDQFDAALFCADHTGGQHRAYANAAVYHYKLPDGTLPKLTKLSAQVTSDPYNSAGARIAILTNATGEIPTNCNTCRTGDAHADGVAPRTVSESGNWFPTMADCVFSATPGEGEVALPTGGLQLQKHLFVFVLMESYSTTRGNWLEGCSFIKNLISIETDAAIPGWTDGETYNLAESSSAEFNVCRGGVLPPLASEVSGVQAIDVTFDGRVYSDADEERKQRLLDGTASLGLRTAYGLLYQGEGVQLPAAEYGLASGARPGVAFSVGVGQDDVMGDVSVIRRWRPSSISDGFWVRMCCGDGVFLAVAGEASTASRRKGLFRSIDGGQNWTSVIGAEELEFTGIAYGDGVFLGVNGGGLWRSTDGGLTWVFITEGDMYCIVYGEGIFLVGRGSHGGLWRSTDGGQTWTSVGGEDRYLWWMISYGNGVFVASARGGGLYRSTDGGQTWTRTDIVDGTWELAYGDGVFLGVDYSAEGLLRSIDGGQTWSIDPYPDNHLEYIAYGDGIFMVGRERAGLWFSNDGGRTWSARTDTMIDTEYNSLAYGDGVFVAGSSNDKGLFLSKIIYPRWRILSSVLAIRTSVPIDFNARKIKLDWSDWSGTVAGDAKFNVWIKRGDFGESYESNVVKNHVIYDATSGSAGGYELVGTIEANSPSRTATLEFKTPITGEVATILLSAFVSMDRVNPSSAMSLPVGVAPNQYVDGINKRIVGVETGWKPDITLLG